MKRVISGVIRSVLMAGVISFAPASFAQFGAPAAVEVAPVESQNLAPSLWVPGSVISQEDSNIAAEIPGRITQVVEVGDRVNAGEVLAKINDKELQLDLKRRRAELVRLQARLAFAERQLERSKELWAANSAAEFRIDELSMERDVLKQEIILANVALEESQYALERSAIRAPFNGVVVERFHQPGEHIGLGEEVLRLVNTDKLEISVRAPLSVAAFVVPGDQVKIKGAATQERLTQVRAVVPVGDRQSRMLELRCVLPATSVIGAAVEVELINGQGAEVTMVPRDALVLRSDDTYVFVVNGEDQARRVKVVPGAGRDGMIAVRGDINPGESVVIRGAERLQDGAKVTVLGAVVSR